MRHPGQRRMDLRGCRAAQSGAEEIRHGHTAKPETGLTEKLPPGLQDLMLSEWIHGEKWKYDLKGMAVMPYRMATIPYRADENDDAH